jgi:RNA ligase (TIGR02306 family)
MATIRKISRIVPIPSADFIAVAEVGGWKSVVKKDEFSVGEYAVFVEIDAWVPIRFAPSLQKPGKPPQVYNGIEGERLRTVQMKGQISQGLILPIKAFVLDTLEQSGAIDPSKPLSEYENLDVSVPLGIQKWETLSLASCTLEDFPVFIPKTDQERVQNLEADLLVWRDRSNSIGFVESWEVTEKLDGSSMTVFFRDGKLGVCSRNKLIVDESGDKFYHKAARDLGLAKKIQDAGKNYAVQGELIGPSVQGNKYSLKALSFSCFDIFDIDGRRHLTPSERQEFCREFSIEHVPILFESKALSETETVESLLIEAQGPSVVPVESDRPVEREGLVFKASTGAISFKAISNVFLLQHKC